MMHVHCVSVYVFHMGGFLGRHGIVSGEEEGKWNEMDIEDVTKCKAKSK